MAGTIQPMAVVATILGLGVAAQVVSDRLQVPSVTFLTLAGIAVGPDGLGVITPTVFGDSLSAIVGLSVAIVGVTVSELMAELPEDCHLALISRDETNQLAHQNDRIELGDHLAFIGRTEAVHQAIEHGTSYY